MVALIVAAEPIVRGLFQYGHFNAADTRMVTWALMGYSIGLPSYVMVKVLTPGFYARQDTRTPLRYAVWSVGVNIVGNLLLIPVIGNAGPPLATALSSSVNVAMLYRTLVKRGHFEADRQLRRRLPRLALAAVLMGAAVYGFDRLLDPFLAGRIWERYAALIVLVGAGCGIYGIACLVTGAFRLSDIRALIRRRGAA
jgi:putative peptidoglycan lipid II flippase